MVLAFQSEPNKQVQQERQTNILKSEEYINSVGKILIPLGAEENGKSIIRDISQIPHILICGFTGTGKTAFVQTLLSVIISKQSSQSVKVLIFDSKRVEYGQFRNSQHLLKPIITNRDGAIDGIKEIAAESRRRFRLLANTSCKDYEKYNLQQRKETDRLPELFVVLDDYSMLDLNRDDMHEFQNVLRNGRIAGIHVILVTAYANTKILQKEVLSSIPCRICFRLSSKAESRIILDQSGAEELFVPGEMIFKFQSDCLKCQCAYATYENIERVMQSIDKRKNSLSDIEIQASNLFSFESTKPLMENILYDDRLNDAAIVVIKAGKASIAMLQKELGISFPKAARLMDQLESLGVVSSESGAVNRIVLMSLVDWKKIQEELVTDETSHVENKHKKTQSEEKTIQNNMPISEANFPVPSFDKVELPAENVISKEKEEDDDEPPLPLRDFHEFKIDEMTISIHDNKICYYKPIMTRLGPGHITPEFSGRAVRGLVCKKPNQFSKGYITFEFVSSLEINVTNSHLLKIDSSNISEVCKIEYGLHQSDKIELFLHQLSEDIGLPIKYV